ncbi:hypothetical protein HYQ44_010875 [Verticillium longisporum]|nr:hypothetical protein HYQ44_010875 [Verticillium longisporum]
MADYIQHRQCQTCFTLFPSNQKLFDHIEEYRSRERLLVAELELSVLEMRTDMILLSSQIYFTARSTNAIRAGRTRLEAISCDTFKRMFSAMKPALSVMKSSNGYIGF